MDDLRNTIVSVLLGGDIAEYIQSIQLLWMPDSKSLSALGVAAGWFRDAGRAPPCARLLSRCSAWAITHPPACALLSVDAHRPSSAPLRRGSIHPPNPRRRDK